MWPTASDAVKTKNNDGEKRWNVTVICVTFKHMENSFGKKIRHSTTWANNTLWSRDMLTFSFHKRQEQASSIQLKRPQRYFHWMDMLSNALGGWTGDLFVAQDSEKNKWESKKIGKQFTFSSANDLIVFPEYGPNRHNSNRVDLIRTDAMEANSDFWIISGNFILSTQVINIMLSTEKSLCASRRIISCSIKVH